MTAVSVAWPLPAADSVIRVKINRDARRSRQVAAVDQPIDKTFSYSLALRYGSFEGPMPILKYQMLIISP